MVGIMDKPNKIKAKLIVEVEGEFYDNESSEETLRYCVEQDLEDAGLNVIDVSVMEWGDIVSRVNKTQNNLQSVWNNLDLAYEHMERAIEDLARMTGLPTELEKMVE